MSMEHKAFVFDTKNYMKQLNNLIVDRGDFMVYRKRLSANYKEKDAS